MNNFFYDKDVEFWIKGKQVNIGGGVIVNSEPSFLSSELVDLQPYSSAQAKRDYGFDISITHGMFSDKDNLEIGMHIVIYNSKHYEVKQKISWDTYTEYLLELK